MHLSRKSFFVLLFLTILGVEAWATHIRAGEIIATRISRTSLRYRFTLVIFSDTGSPIQVGEGGIFNFGQGRVIDATVGNRGRAFLVSESVFFEETNLGNEVRRTVLEFEHTFDAPGVYTISYTEQNRNNEILNVNGGSSDQIAFHIETVIVIDPFLDVNSTPILTVPPVDRACIGATFFHNPGAFDPDGDSLAYRLVTPLQERGITVTNYQPLNDASISNLKQDGTSPALFEIDSLTGLFTWDAPQIAGEYNAAFIVEEWRFSQFTQQYELLGYVTRDMQIIVEDCDNERPEIMIPPDTCIEAGSLLEAEIIGEDPDGNLVLLEGFGGVFELTENPAQFLPDPATFRAQPVTKQFRWETNLSHVRARPYQVQFKITDAPFDPEAPPLVDFKTWEIRVVAPAPTGLTASISTGQSIQLNWDEYIGKDFGPTIEIYRRAESFDFDPEHCVTGIPANSGYELVGEVPVDQTDFLDDNNVRPGVNYCYRIVARFPAPKGGESYASNEFCVLIPVDVPAITNATVLETSETDGEVRVNWTPPLEIDQTLFPPPYRYELVRYEGLNGTSGRRLVTSTADTVFTDTGLNTTELPYNYRVILYDGGDNLVDSSATASTVRLDAQALIKSVELSWEADVPWSNRVQDFPYHYIYRNRLDAAAENTTTYDIIDSVNVTTNPFRYLDDGRFNGIELDDDKVYGYFVTTQGSYGNPIIEEPLLNDSQILFVQPSDSIPPNEPEIEIPNPGDSLRIGDLDVILVENDRCDLFANEPCGFANYSNEIEWTVDDEDGDIASYNIYFSESGEEDTFILISNTPLRRFTHTNLESFKGCYRISSVDRSGNESELSTPICFDNCPAYELPNAFTPNGDGVNDTFRAFDQPNSRCPRFVESVEVQIFNRQGGEAIFTYNSATAREANIFIDWDGKDNDGNSLPSGTYYYRVIVTYDVLNPRIRTEEFRNWVQLIR